MSKDCGACGSRHADGEPCEETIPELVQAITLVSNFFNGDDTLTARWLTLPNPHFGGATPVNLFRRGRGHKVLAWIKSTLEENKI